MPRSVSVTLGVLVALLLGTMAIAYRSRPVAGSSAKPVRSMPNTGAQRYAAPVSAQLPQMPSPAAMAARAEAEKAEQQRKIGGAVAEMSQAYARETLDPAWAPAKEHALQPLANQPQIVQMGATPKALEIHCRSSICKVEARFDSQAQANDWLSVFTASLGGQVSFGVTDVKQEPDGTITASVYGRAR